MTTSRDRIHACACAGDFASPSASEHYPPDLRLEPVHLDIALHVDLEAETAEGVVTARIRANADGPSALVLDAVAFEDVRVETAATRSDYDGAKLAIHFDAPFAKGEEREVAVRYRVTRPSSGLHFSRPTAAVPDAPLFAVTDHETERARHWLPCVDLPTVRPTLAFHLRAASSLVVLANGALEREVDHGDGTKTVHYRLDHPCPSYLTCFAIGDFVRADGGVVRDVPVAAYAPRPFTEEHLARSFGKTADMLRFFEAKLGVPYPFPKYAQFAAKGIGGAMENISLVSWDDRFLLDASLETEERQLVDVVNVHEMAHAWFGDHVVCRDFAHAWLKESWATYMETVWLEDTLGPDAASYDLLANAEAYFAECDDRYKRPIVTRRFDSSWDMYDMHLYPGGAWRLHMLRKTLGDAVFWPAVTDYLRTYGRSVVETDDFRRLLERHSGRSLGRFFDQWLRSPGFPELHAELSWDAEKREATLVVEQKQVDEKAGIPCFELELDVLFVVGEEETRRTLSFASNRSVLTVPLRESPTEVVLDPDQRLLARIDFDPGTERTRRQLVRGRDVRQRIEAGRRLVKSARPTAIAAVADAFGKEPYWGVRVRWAEALGDSGTEAALEALLRLAGTHDDPRVLPTLFRALGRYRDPRVASVAADRLAGLLGPRAREAAHEALGAQREAAPMDVLRAAAALEGPGAFAQGGALRALGATRRPEALDVLLEASTPARAPIRARPSACAGLGALAPSLERGPRGRAIEALVDRLRDPDAKVRAAAANALVAARAKETTDALEAYRLTLPAQERVRLGRAIAGLAKADEELSKSQEKRIEKLEAELRKLSARVDSVEARPTS